jgi:hypothetical protein
MQRAKTRRTAPRPQILRHYRNTVATRAAVATNTSSAVAAASQSSRTRSTSSRRISWVFCSASRSDQLVLQAEHLLSRTPKAITVCVSSPVYPAVIPVRPALMLATLEERFYLDPYPATRTK